MVGYTFNFTDVAQETHRLFRNGTLGSLNLVTCTYSSIAASFYAGRPDLYDSWYEYPLVRPKPETYSSADVAGGGHAVTQLTHALGMLFWLVDHSALKVAAFSDDSRMDLSVAAAFALEDGAIGQISGTGGVKPAGPERQELVFYGSGGVATFDLLGGQLRVELEGGRSWQAVTQEAYPVWAPSRAFVDLINGSRMNPAPGECGARAVEFVEAIYRSAREEEYVSIPPLIGTSIGMS